MVSSAAKRAKRKRLAHERQERELFRPTRQMDPVDFQIQTRNRTTERSDLLPEDRVWSRCQQRQRGPGYHRCDIVNMIKTLNGAIAAVSQDTAKIQRAYEQLRAENIARDRALTDLSEIVKEYGLAPVHIRPQPVLQADVMDEEGNLRAADIGITWENNETFLHGVRVVGPGSTTTWNETGDVDATPTDRRTRPGQFTIDTTKTCRHRADQWEDETGILHLDSSSADTRDD